MSEQDDAAPPPAFLGTPLVVGRPNASGFACARCKCAAPAPDGQPQPKKKVGRRQAIRLFALALVAPGAARARHARAAADGEVCVNCKGEGHVVCDLCGGSGFWNAFMGRDEALKYKGVQCPSCDGAGEITCPVCLGTGEGNVRGLLRRRSVEPGPGRILQS